MKSIAISIDKVKQSMRMDGSYHNADINVYDFKSILLIAWTSTAQAYIRQIEADESILVQIMVSPS